MKFAVITDLHLDAYDKKLEEFGQFIKQVESQVDAFICAGDWCSSSVLELEAAFKTMRERTNLPFLTVFGNHDFWCSDGWSLDEIISYQQEMCLKYQVTNLNENSFSLNEIFITGFDGWYARKTTSTQDYSRIPLVNSLGADSFHFLKRKEQLSLGKILDEEVEAKTKVCVTHFGWHHSQSFKDWEANPNHLDLLKEKFNLIIVGHSHQVMDEIEDGVRIINAGADYLKSPQWFCKIIEL